MRLWFFSPERLWLLSIALQRRGHWVLAFWAKQLNTLLYRNSLAAGAVVSPDISLGHYSFGVVVNGNVVVGRRVKIHHNVTLTVRASGLPVKLVLEDDVRIGANAVVITPRGRSLHIGQGARIGAGTVVTHDVPAGATVVAAPVRVLLRSGSAENAAAPEESEGEPTVANDVDY
jgi:serine O-acetyltransferase